MDKVLLFIIFLDFSQRTLTSNQTKGLWCTSSVENEFGQTIGKVSCEFEKTKCDSPEEGLTLSHVEGKTFRVYCKCPPDINNCHLVPENANGTLQHTSISVTLLIENVNDMQTGQYRCELVQTGVDTGNIHDVCALKLLATSTTTTSQSPLQDMPKDTHQPFTNIPVPEDSSSVKSTAALAISCIGFLLILITVSVLVYILNRNKKQTTENMDKILKRLTQLEKSKCLIKRNSATLTKPVAVSEEAGDPVNSSFAITNNVVTEDTEINADVRVQFHNEREGNEATYNIGQDRRGEESESLLERETTKDATDLITEGAVKIFVDETVKRTNSSLGEIKI